MAGKGTYPIDKEKVRMLALEQGMSIAGLIESAGINRNTYYRDGWHYPSTIKLIADALGVNVKDIIKE